jgi:hypothetical protein
MNKLIFTILFGMAYSSFGRPVISYSGLTESGIRILTPETQEFRDELQALTAGSSHPLLDETLPYSVIVKNTSTRFIATIVVIYNIKNSEGNPVDHTFALSSLYRHRARLMAPGESRLVGPVPFLYETVNRRQLAGALPLDNAANENVQQRLRNYTNQQSIHVTLDSVVFEDGELIGPDKANMLGVLNSWIRAEQELREAVGTKNGVELKLFLEEILSRPTNLRDPSSAADQYAIRRQGLARAFLHDLQISEQVFRDRLATGAGMLISTVYRRVL